MNYDKKLEKRILRHWKKDKTFEKLLKKNRRGKRWSFIDGPITANNPMGVHHAWGRTYKDLFQRYKAMQGFQQRFQNGFDCHGLPVEVNEEKDRGFKNKKDIEKFGIEKFCRACKARVKKFSKIQTEQSKKLGQWMDWDNSYYTMSDENIEHVWLFLKKCWQKGWLYKGKKILPWCIRCGTSLSQHEQSDEGYAELTHPAVFVKAKLKGRDEYLLIWTTTEWTLSSNVAVAVNPDFNYTKVDKDGETLYLSEKTLKCLGGNYLILDTVKGSDLVGLEYESFYPDFEVQKGIKHKVVAWDEVGEEEGTGIVHIAPTCGAEDYELGKKLHLPIIAPALDENGVYEPGFGWMTGKKVTEIKQAIFDDLKTRGILFKKEDYTHRYPVCWRCKEELVFRMGEAWFIKVDEIRPKMKKAANSVTWSPKHVGKLMQDWLNNMEDWNISRKRYWGLPLMFYECECGHLEVIGSVKELRKKAVNKKMVDALPELHRPWIDRVVIRCPKCKATVKRVEDVGDCWLDAGIVPFSTLKYMKDRNFWKLWFPAELVIEMRAQVRLWFYSLLFMGVTLENRSPYRRLFGYEEVRDENGESMHKSKGNVIWFDEAVTRMGADVMRWMYISQNPSYPLNFGYTPAKEVRGKLNIIYNFVNFVETYCEANSFRPHGKPRITPIDKWLLSRLQTTKADVTKHLEELKPHLAAKTLEEFLLNDLSRCYGHHVRQRVKTGYNGKDKKAALWTLYKVTLESLQLLAPMLPFITEDLYLRYFKKFERRTSIHLTDWPKVEKRLLNKRLESEMRVVQEVIETANALRSEKGLRLRWPVKALVVSGWNPRGYEDVIKKLANVKEVRKGKTEAKVEVKLNYSVVGKKYGKRVKELEKELNKKSFAKAPKTVKIGKVVLKGNELVVREKAVNEGKTFSRGVVALDTSEDEGLKKERFVRELIRRIQQERKAKGLMVKDKIVLVLSKKIGYENEIRKVVGARSVRYGKGKTKFKFGKESLWFSVKK